MIEVFGFLKCVWLIFAGLGSEFWSAIAGALVGGVIAVLIQRQERFAARDEREANRREEAKALGYSLLFKVVSIHSSLSDLKKHVDARLELGKKVSVESVTAVLLPNANLPTETHFLPAEMAMLLSLKDDNVFNSLLNLDAIHNSIIPVWSMYAEKRASLYERGINHEFEMGEGRGQFSIKKGSYEEALMFELEDLAKSIVERSSQDLIDATLAVENLLPLLNSRLNLGVQLQIKAG